MKTKKKNQELLSVIIIAKNEEEKLPGCLESIDWADEIILVDTDSTDKTVSIAKKAGARIISYPSGSFSDWRNAGLKAAKSKWILYVDADERVTPELHEELNLKMKSSVSPYAYAVPRKNFILRKEMKHGGQWPDYQMRFFRKDKLKGYKNDLHEVAEFEGKEGHLSNPLIHLKHDNLSDMVTKSNKWSLIEAKLLFDTKHPQMVWWRFIRIMMTELWVRLVIQKGILDGGEGIIYSIYQAWSKFMTYGKLWEMQIADHAKSTTDKL
jgi:glycosyltransferase involved in cell wall biosynthesis